MHPVFSGNLSGRDVVLSCLVFRLHGVTFLMHCPVFILGGVAVSDIFCTFAAVRECSRLGARTPSSASATKTKIFYDPAECEYQ